MNTPSGPSHPHFRADPPGDATRIERLVGDALEQRVFSAAGLLIATPEAILFEKTWGSRSFDGPPVDSDTFFDLASLTKPLVTVPLYMLAMAEERISLDAPLHSFLPEASGTVASATIEDLLSHRSGLPAYRPFFETLVRFPQGQRRQELLSRILSEPLTAPPGERAEYSDLGYLLLGFLLERICSSRLDQLYTTRVLSPLGIDTLRFLPIETQTDPTVPPVPSSGFGTHRFVATQVCPWRKRLLIGEVDDENAWCLGGVAGHAGLFGTSRGIFALLRTLWRVYKGAGPAPSFAVTPDLLRRFWTRRGTRPDDTWALGSDTPSPSNSSAGTRFSTLSVGHLGFTGTSFWMDLQREVMVVLLTNRIHPSRQDDRIRPFRPALHDAAMEYVDALSKR